MFPFLNLRDQVYRRENQRDNYWREWKPNSIHQNFAHQSNFLTCLIRQNLSDFSTIKVLCYTVFDEWEFYCNTKHKSNTNSDFSKEVIRSTILLIWTIMTSEPMTTVMVTERTNGLSIRNVWSNISSYSI